MLVMSFAFVYTGKIKSTIFDKKDKKLQIRKRNILCCRKSVTNYCLDEVVDVYAVWRGIRSGAVDNQKFSIILEFQHTQETNATSESDEPDGNEFSIPIEESQEKMIELQDMVSGKEKIEISLPRKKVKKWSFWNIFKTKVI